MRKTLMVMAAAVVAAIGLTAAPAQAATGDVNMPFGMAYGASTTSGTIHFTTGYSATVTGAVHAVSTEKFVCANGSNGAFLDEGSCSNFAVPGGPNVAYTINLRIPHPGGVQTVYIGLADDISGTVLAEEHCTRNGCTRDF
jgi:hypothetical protein